MIRDLHFTKKFPYYIFAPDYAESFAGVRALHYLCHALNESGQEAYLLTENSPPHLRTPPLVHSIAIRHAQSSRLPIIVYPEVVSGHPLKIDGVIVRWLLNIPGHLGGDTNYPKDNLLFAYEECFALPGMQAHILHMPTVDLSIFNNDNNPADNERDLVCYYASKYLFKGYTLTEHIDGACSLCKDQQLTRLEIAALLRRSKLLIVYEPTALISEALLCGCAVCIVRTDYWKLVDQGNRYDEIPGVYMHDDPAAAALAPQAVKHFIESYKTHALPNFWSQLDHFIELTQAEAARRAPPSPVNHWSSQNSTWIATQRLTETDAQILAERMVLNWKHRPGMHLLMSVRQGDDSLMAETLNSLGGQLYPNWRLTVVSDLPAPEGWQELPNLQWLALRDAMHIDYVIDEMAASSSSDWIARISPGVSLAPHALLLISDYLLRHPDWRLIYTDEDVLLDKDVHTQPRFKPGFNLEHLRSSNYLGSLVLIRKDAFLAVGRYGPHAGAQDYDVALRIADMVGPSAIGHIPSMLVHVNAQTRNSKSLAAESLALNDHLRRHGITAAVNDGLQPNTRRLQYRWHHPFNTSLVLAVRDELELIHPLLDKLKPLPCAEVLVMDLGSNDPDMRAFLAEQQTHDDWQGRLKVLDTTETTWSQTAANAASGEFLFLLDSRTAAPEAADLATMGAIAQCPGTGAVAPCLIQAAPNGLVMNGDWSLAEYSVAVSGQDQPGPLGLGQCTHNKLAVSRLPLLVRKSAFVEAGGLDLVNFTLSDAVTDLCIRLNQRGHALIWTPHVTLGLLCSDEENNQNLQTDINSHSSRRLLEKHIRALTNDATRHPLWSLERPGQLDHAIPVAWTKKPGGREKPHILRLVTDGEPAQETDFNQAVARWQRDAEMLLITVDLRTQSLSPLSVAKWMPDALILHATIAEPVQKLLEEIACMLPEVQRVVRLDSLDFLPTPKGADITAARPLLRKLLRHATKVIVPTQELAALCSGLVDQILVHQSLEALSASEWLGYSFDRRRVGSTFSEPTTVS